jgi:hypothetical protein
MPNQFNVVPMKAVIDGLRSGVADVGRILNDLFGIKLSRNEEPGWFGFDQPGFVALAAGQQGQTGVMTLDATYDFVAAGVYFTSHETGDPTVRDQPYLWDVQLGSSDRHLVNTFQHSDMLGGRHMYGPLWFSKLAYLSRQSRVIWTFNSILLSDIRIYGGFIGYRIYDKSQLDLT